MPTPTELATSVNECTNSQLADLNSQMNNCGIIITSTFTDGAGYSGSISALAADIDALSSGGDKSEFSGALAANKKDLWPC